MDLDGFGIPTEDFEHFRAFVEEGGGHSLSTFLSENADEWKECVLDIAVCGETYVGKSTFINKLRGVDENDEGYAPVGIGDTTLAPTPYKHPKNEKMVFWDLPGVGTLRFSRDRSYLRTIKVERYDFFLIFSDQCFSENDAWIAREIQNLGKDFFFVRSKLDEGISNASKDGQCVEEVIPRLHFSCLKNLRKAGVKKSKIFIISNYNHEIGQFDDLMTAILETLPCSKREAVLHTIGPLTHQIIREKKKMLQNRTFLKGFLPAFSSIPLIGKFFNDIELIEEELEYCMAQFGLDETSLDRLCHDDKSFKYQLTSSLKNYTSLKERGDSLKKKIMAFASLPWVKKHIVGFKENIVFCLMKIAADGVLSYGTTVYFLREQINLMEEDAHVLVELVLKQHRM